jgi:hypothetical protein
MIGLSRRWVDVITAYFQKGRKDDEAALVGARLITRMLRDLGRQRGVALEEVTWLPDPSEHEAATYALVIMLDDRKERQIFAREDLETVAECDLTRRRIVVILKSLLGAFLD